MFEVVAAVGFAAAMYAQLLDVRTTNTILVLPGGYEKNKLIAKLQEKFPCQWGKIKMGTAAAAMLGAGAIVGPVGVIAISIPLMIVSVRVIVNNRAVIRRLTKKPFRYG